MTHIVTENCGKCRFTECVETCPVACFHQDEDRLYIDPKVCIDCAACVPACPVHAIYDEFDLPVDQREWVAINAERASKLPVIDRKEDPKPGADYRKAELGF